MMDILKTVLYLERYRTSLNPFKRLYAWYKFRKLMNTVAAVFQSYDTTYDTLMEYCSLYELLFHRKGSMIATVSSCKVHSFTWNTTCDETHQALNSDVVHFTIKVYGERKIYTLNLNTEDDGIVNVCIQNGDILNNFDITDKTHSHEMEEVFDKIQKDFIAFLALTEKYRRLPL